MLLFDTHEYVKRLKAVGFSEEQAETLYDVQRSSLNEELATKTDIAGLKTELLKWVISIFIAQTGIVIASFVSIAKSIK